LNHPARVADTLLVKKGRVFLLADIKSWAQASIEAVLAAQTYDQAQEAPGEACVPGRVVRPGSRAA
jgi:hypothetical protein